MIRLAGVSKVFRSARGEVRALDDVTLDVPTGQFVAVRGPSGCGKSTLLSLIGGLALPTSGEVEVAGQRISTLGPSQRAEFRATKLGFVFQMFHLLPYLNVLDNVLAGAMSGQARDCEPRARELLGRFGLEPRLTHRPGQLSAGERQRVAMARALLNRPPLLLADEPTGNLDPDSAEALLDLLGEFHRDGGTILLVTHDDRAAARAERTVALAAGRLQPAESSAAGR
ncbi:MAG: ABC transporter ATP-binding protein [Pirellulaceae bacterium]|nr:ABC transporter ATP-binding protein [Pirellulaceae bacterium]